MKKFILPLMVLTILFSCSSDDDMLEQEQITEPLVITKADYETNYSAGGETFTLFAPANLNVTIPIPGEDQTWDFSTLEECCSSVLGGSEFLVPSDPAFPSATYSAQISGYYTISGVDSNDFDGEQFYELNNNGIFGLGSTQNQPASINVEAIGAVISYEPQIKPFTGTPKSPTVLFPAEYGDAPITTSGIINASSFTVDAPAFGLSNTPGQTVNTTDITQEVIASGTANFKGIGNKRVLVTKNTTSTTVNYFLGGAPAPAELLALLGTTDGTVTTRTTYRFIAEGLGTSVIINIDESGSITSASFRKE